MIYYKYCRDYFETIHDKIDLILKSNLYNHTSFSSRRRKQNTQNKIRVHML